MGDILKTPFHPEKKEHPSKIFLEIGTHMTVPGAGNKKFGPNDTYIGVDIDTANIPGAHEQANMVRSGLRPENIHFEHGDGKHLRFENESIDEVFLGNVIGSGAALGKEYEFIIEARRILKEKGQIIINESLTPPPLQQIKNLFFLYGIKIDRMVAGNEAGYKGELMKYTQETNTGFGFPSYRYIIYASKTLEFDPSKIEYPQNPGMVLKEYIEETPLEDLSVDSIFLKTIHTFKQFDASDINSFMRDMTAMLLKKGEKERGNLISDAGMQFKQIDYGPKFPLTTGYASTY